MNGVANGSLKGTTSAVNGMPGIKPYENGHASGPERRPTTAQSSGFVARGVSITARSALPSPAYTATLLFTHIC